MWRCDWLRKGSIRAEEPIFRDTEEAAERVAWVLGNDGFRTLVWFDGAVYEADGRVA